MTISRRQFLRSSAATAAFVPLAMTAGIDYCEAATASPVDLSMGFPPGAVRLNFNENTLGPSPKAVEGAVPGARLANRYALSSLLPSHIGEYHDVDPDWVLMGNGSSEILRLAPIAYGRNGGNLISGLETWGGLLAVADNLGMDVRRINLKSDAGYAFDVERMLEAVDSETRMLMVVSPNNPTGVVFPRSWVEALTSWAAGEGLWIVSDEVYEDYVYEGSHTYARSVAPDRTFSAHSFSKAFGMAGNRCGFVVGPAAAMGGLCKVSTHSFYSTPTASQIAACRALDGRGDAWIAGIKGQYRQAGRRMARRLGLEPPAGSTFLFLDVAERLDDRGLMGFLEDCAERGLFLAPGPSFGPYPTHVRVCFTCAPPDVVERGSEILASLVGR